MLHCELYRHSTETATDSLTAVTCTTSWLEVVSIIRETEIPLGVLTSCTSYSLYVYGTWLFVLVLMSFVCIEFRACLNSLHVDGSALSQLKKTMVHFSPQSCLPFNHRKFLHLTDLLQHMFFGASLLRGGRRAS